MSDQAQVYRRILRRETHSSRSAAGIVSALILALVLAAVAFLAGWWLFAPDARGGIESVVGALPTQNGVDWVVAAGVASVIIGIILLIVALSPGRLSRHGRSDNRTVHLVDDTAFADAIADAVASATAVERGRVAVTVRSTSARVEVTPTSGVAVDTEAARSVAERVANEVGFPLRVEVRVKEGGAVA